MARTTEMLLLAVMLLSLMAASVAEIKTLQITSDSRPMILFEKFGFTHTGQVSLAVSGVAVQAISTAAGTPVSSRIGFFLLSDESLLQVVQESTQTPNFCVLDAQFTIHLCTFQDLTNDPVSFNGTYPVKIPNEYSLYFANCNPETLVTMSVRTEIYNLDGRVRD